MTPVDFTLLQVNAHPDDVADAIALLAPDWSDGRVVGYPDFWSVVPVTPAGARTLAPRLAPMLGVRVVTVTVDAERCTLWLTTPDGTEVGPLDGRSSAPADAFTAAFRKQKAAPEIVAALADEGRDPTERHRIAAKLLGLPMPDFDKLHGRPGVLLVSAPAQVVRDRLPVEGHGAWVLPYGPEQTLVVPDGSGTAPRPEQLQPAFATIATSVGVHWGDKPTFIAAGRSEQVDLDLSEQNKDRLEKTGERVGAVLGRPELAEPIDRLLASTTAADDRAAGLLQLFGVEEVPVTASVERLAEWAAGRDGADRVVARHDTAPTLLHSDSAELTSTFRRRRTIRRIRRGVLVFTVAAGVGVLYSWSEAKFGWLLPTGGAFVVLLVLWIVLGRVIAPANRRKPTR